MGIIKTRKSSERGTARAGAVVIAVMAAIAAGCRSSTGRNGASTPPTSADPVATSADPSAASAPSTASGAGASSGGSTSTDSSPGATTSSSTSSTSSTSSGAPPSGSDPIDKLPEGPLTEQIRWYVDVLRSGTASTVAELQQHFAASTLAELPPDQLRTALQQVIASKPGELRSFSGNTRLGMAVLSLADDQRLLVTIAVDDDGMITSLLNQSAPALPTIESPSGLFAAATAAGSRSSLLVADDSCRPLPADGSAVNADQAVPLGSMFKLYVLGAVTLAVRAGRLRWQDSLTIDAAIRSLPSGRLQDSPPNSRVTVQEAATLMISISDNTAADALIRAVGQRAVEAAVRAMGSRHPGLLSPFPTTKQIFTLAADAPLRKEWSATFDRAAGGAMAESTAAQIAARRILIAKIPGTLPSPAAFSGAPAGWPDGVEWFASAADICRAQVALHALAATPAGAPLRTILTMNPGVGDLGAPIGSLAFKGGGDTGVLAGSWLLERKDGGVRVLVWMLRGETAAKVPDTQYFAVAARSALRLLAR